MDGSPIPDSRRISAFASVPLSGPKSGTCGTSGRGASRSGINTTPRVAKPPGWVYPVEWSWVRAAAGRVQTSPTKTKERGIEHFGEDDRRGHKPRISVRLRDSDRVRVHPARAQRGHHPAELREEERARVHAGLAPARLPALDRDGARGRRAPLGEPHVPVDRLRQDRLLLGAEAPRGGEPGRGGSGDPQDLREARHP